MIGFLGTSASGTVLQTGQAISIALQSIIYLASLGTTILGCGGGEGCEHFRSILTKI